MNVSTVAAASARGADLDPEVREFVTKMSAAFASYLDFNDLPPSEMRRACEQVRAPWAAGGSIMAQRIERTVPTPVGTVRVRIHNPSARANKPALIYLHGGGWTTFSIDTHDRLMREYAARANIVVIGVDYALSPEVKFPVAQQQIAVHAVVTNYAVADTYSAPETLQRYGYEGYILGADEMVRFWNNYLRSQEDARNPLVCPVHADLRGQPPVFMEP